MMHKQRDSNKHLPTARLLAADLVGAEVDINEAQKALSYLLTRKQPREFFDLLRQINKHGYIVMRSKCTVGYYRELQAACERHLGGLEKEEMAQTLGWAIRLMRYYQAVPDMLDEADEPAPAPPAPPQAAARLPQVGEVFRGTIVDVGKYVELTLPDSFMDATNTIVPLPAGAANDVLVAIPPRHMGSGMKKGNRRWVEVVNVRTVKGTQVIEVKLAARPPHS